MKNQSAIPSLARAVPRQVPGLPPRPRDFLAANPALESWQSPVQCLRENDSPASVSLPTKAALIYVVDDEEGLTELYSIFLKEVGYLVRAFNRQAAALAALATESDRPALLVMDYLGHAMPVNHFMQRCVIAHPALRFLIASGVSEPMHTRLVKPASFILKPFTGEEFRQAVRAALVAG